MSVYPPNPINTFGKIHGCNSDKDIAKKARYLFGVPKSKKEVIKNVYFVLASDNLVKIGYSTNVNKRIQNLSVLHPSFVLLGYVGNKTEKEVHNTFSPFRVKGEWYRYDGSMIDFIKVNSPSR